MGESLTPQTNFGLFHSPQAFGWWSFAVADKYLGHFFCTERCNNI